MMVHNKSSHIADDSIYIYIFYFCLLLLFILIIIKVSDNFEN